MISIIIVSYKAEKAFLACINSIKNARISLPFEVIVVDNNEGNSSLGKKLKEYPFIHYFKSEKNLGFGGGNNLGGREAKGEFLFFLNPDTILLPKTVEVLYEFLEKNSKTAIAAPLLLDTQKKPYPLQGNGVLGIKEALFANSIFDKFFPQNPIARKYWLLDWDKTTIRKVDVAPGTAFMIKKSIFEKVGAFDEQFFLFFDEHDLAQRVRKKGYDSYIVPKAKVIHLWGESTKTRRDIDEMYKKSRRLYFRKYYGRIVEIFLSLFYFCSFPAVLVTFFSVLGLYLRLYQLDRLMFFIGDAGWFYLSARDMLLSGHIPLVGIASSHPWLHQGAFWTYLLSLALLLWNFYPISGAYLTVFFGTMTIIGIYFVGKSMFSTKIGLIASFLYASSPLVVINDRIPYHTSPIPFFVLLLLFCIYKFLKGESSFLLGAVFVSFLLYNFELATAPFILVSIGAIIYGVFVQKRKKEILNKKLLFLAFFAFFIPMAPMLLYDMSHGFLQTFGFVAWVGYKMLKVFGMFGHISQASSLNAITDFLLGRLGQGLFIQNQLFAFSLFVASLASMVSSFVSGDKNNRLSIILLGLFLFIPIIAIFLSETASDAYVSLVFPQLILVIAFAFGYWMKKKVISIVFIFLLVFIAFSNTQTLLQRNYLMGDRNEMGIPFAEKVALARQIIKQSGDKKYSLKGVGPGSKFRSFTMTYEYLTWWLGKEPALNASLQFLIQEDKNGVTLKKRTLR